MKGALRVLLFGPPHITHDGVAIRGFESRKALVLFAYLVVQNAPVPRSQLTDLFWPDQSETRGRGNLRRVLHNIASLLPGYLLIERQHVQFNRAMAGMVDVHAFAGCVAQKTRTALATAAALYRGAFLDGVFLDDCPDAEMWLLQERELWQQRALSALEKLAEQCRAQHDFAAAIEAFERVAELDPWREETHRHLMQLLHASGQRHAATAHYRAYAQRLHHELGVAPAGETTALFEHIRRDETTHAAHGARYTVPTPPTALLGRVTEAAQIARFLHDPACRLLTLTGPGGTGKTHLALATLAEVLPRFPNGVWFVDLAPISDPALVAPTIAQVLGMPHRADASPQQALVAWLRDKHLLLCLDNFEQLLDAAPLVSALLAACPRLNVLVTSRAALELRGEQCFPIEPLALPDIERVQMQRTNRVATVRESPAVVLFVARATNVLPTFTLAEANALTVAEICVRLDGLPLAIELAAPLLKRFSLDALLARLDQRLAVLSSGMRDHAPRHMGMHATIDWSYQLLDAPAQQLFARLGVFVGGWTLADAEALNSDTQDSHTSQSCTVLDGLAALLNQSLIQQRLDGQGNPRFTMLETIREYAHEQLAAHGSAEAVHQRHCAIYHALATEAAPHLWHATQPAWLARLADEHNNLRAALGWAYIHGAIEDMLQMGFALRLFWLYRGHQREGRQWLEQGIARAEEAHVPASIHGYALYAAGLLATWDADFASAQGFFERSVVLFRAHKLVSDIVLVQYELGNALTMQGQYAQAEPLLAEAMEMARAIDDHYMYHQSMARLGTWAVLSGDAARAVGLFETSWAELQRYNDTQINALMLTFWGMARLHTGELALAETAYQEALRLFRATRGRLFLSFPLLSAAGMAVQRGDIERATTLLSAIDALHALLGTTLVPALRPWHAQIAARIHATLPDEQEHAWTRGLRLSPEQAIAYALGEA